MSDHVQKTIDDAQKKLRQLEEEVTKTKRFINQACEFAGLTILYPDADDTKQSSIFAIRPDQFYGKGISTAAREYLDLRRSANLGAASLDEVFAALKQGGFKFDGDDEVAQKRGLAISLSKNTSIFHKLPNGSIGLLAWYPEAKEAKKAGKAEQPNGDKTEIEEPPDKKTESEKEEDAKK